MTLPEVRQLLARERDESPQVFNMVKYMDGVLERAIRDLVARVDAHDRDHVRKRRANMHIPVERSRR